ncbi:MAG: ABC-2 family transporter protein [Dongiaceae bacterium]
MRVLRLLRSFWTNALQVELEFRADLIVNLINAPLMFGAGLAVLAAVFAETSSVGGWSFDEAVAVLGVFLIVDGFVGTILSPNLGRLPDYIRLGNLDYMLLMPVGSHFQVSLRNLNLWEAPNLLLGTALVVWSMLALDRVDPTTIALFLLMLAAGLATAFALWSIIYTSAFWFVRVSNLEVMFRTLVDVGRFPVSALPPWLRLLLTAVLPVAFITNVPAAAVAGRLDWTTGWLALLIAAIALAVSHLFWRRAIASYTSASS